MRYLGDLIPHAAKTTVFLHFRASRGVFVSQATKCQELLEKRYKQGKLSTWTQHALSNHSKSLLFEY